MRAQNQSGRLFFALMALPICLLVPGSHQNFGRTSNKPDKGYHIQEITIQTLSRLNLQPEGWNGGIQIQQNGAYKMISKPDGGSPT